MIMVMVFKENIQMLHVNLNPQIYAPYTISSSSGSLLLFLIGLYFHVSTRMVADITDFRCGARIGSLGEQNIWKTCILKKLLFCQLRNPWSGNALKVISDWLEIQG